MSTLSVSNITDGTDTVETGYVVNGSAKAFCVWNASSGTPTSLQSLNVSSLTDTNTGQCVVNYSSSMANTDSIISGGVGNGGSKGWMYDNNSASSVRVETQNIASTPSYTDYDNVSVAIHGDLA